MSTIFIALILILSNSVYSQTESSNSLSEIPKNNNQKKFKFINDNELININNNKLINFEVIDIEVVEITDSIYSETNYDKVNLENIEFKKGAKFTFTYRTSTDTKPTKELIAFLDKLAAWMKNNPNGNIRITGHSDQNGTGKEIHERSVQRAKNVKDYLITKSKSNTKNILISGEGARVPIADIYSEMGKAQNRRVVIDIISE